MSYNFNAGEIFKIAIEIEENGKKFYEESLKKIDVPGVKKLFLELIAQEQDHKKRFESLYAQLPSQSTASTVWDPDNELDQYIKMMADQHIFLSGPDVSARIAEIKGVEDALRLAINFEKDSVIFFLSMEDAAAGKKDQELIETLVKEEREHLRRLTLELVKISKK
jgi:rubrerythrin